MKFVNIHEARAAKKDLNKTPFYGNLLQVSYHPESESPNDVLEKLELRRKEIQFRLDPEHKQNLYCEQTKQSDNELDHLGDDYEITSDPKTGLRAAVLRPNAFTDVGTAQSSNPRVNPKHPTTQFGDEMVKPRSGPRKSLGVDVISCHNIVTTTATTSSPSLIPTTVSEVTEQKNSSLEGESMGRRKRKHLPYEDSLNPSMNATVLAVRKKLQMASSTKDTSSVPLTIFSRLAFGFKGASVNKTGCSSGATLSSL
eukprot:TRINITY_DN10781_c0_g1_i1.p1 TRINITY_DN10781_c0_g1~~TRINITY_DN10781_c0_g1_i1.p1  ORF type:complete len:255 (-),score=67.26 TRINITY_DN10781_c0_g1_i1:46-810(-)